MDYESVTWDGDGMDDLDDSGFYGDAEAGAPDDDYYPEESDWYGDAYAAQWDDDPDPYSGTYSEC